MRVALTCLLAWAGVAGSQAWAQDASMRSDVAVRVAYFVAGAAPVHVRIGERTLVSPLAAGSVTGYRFVPSGDVELTILDASEDTDDALGPGSVPVLARASRTWESGSYYTVILTERTAEDASADADAGSASVGASLDMHVIHDRLDAFAASGESRLRVLNFVRAGAAWSAYGARVEDGTGSDGRAASDEVRLADSVPFADAGGWVRAPRGYYRIRFDPGTGGDAVPEPLDVVLHGGAHYTAFLYGGPAEDAPQVAIAVDAVVRAPVGDPPPRPGGPP